MKPAFLSAIATAISIITLACATTVGQVSQPTPPAPSQNDASIQPESAPKRPDEVQLIKGPVSEDGYQAIFATPDLGVGENRVGVVVTAPEGLVRSPGATFSSIFFSDENLEGDRRETKLAVFRVFPLGTRGLYSTRMTFDRPGHWGLEVTVLDENGTGRQVELSFEVLEKPVTPAAGDAAIASISKTIRDVEDIADLTTGSLQDEDLYQLTIAEAIETGLPTVVVMASPAFCTNAVCGPQVDVLSDLKNRYEGQANFIHVDFYDNPAQIQGDLRNAVISPTILEWNLPSTEWSFVIDRDGKIAERFESFVTFSELESALKSVL